MFLCIFSFFLFFSQKKPAICSLFNLLFLNASLFFQNKNSVGKTSCVLVYRSLFSVFLSSVFHVVFCLIFLDLLRIMCPFKMSCVPLYFLFWFISFHPFSLPLLNFVFLLFLLSPCFFMSNSFCYKKGIYLSFCKNFPFSLLFSIKKTSFSVSFFVGLLKIWFFSMLGFFCVLKNDFSFCTSLLFFSSSFEHCFSFLLSFFLKYQKKERCSCWKMEQKLSFVFCFCSLGFKNMLRPTKIRFIFHYFWIVCINSSLSLHLKPLKKSAKNLHFFVSVPYLLRVCFQHFPCFFHHCFLCPLFPFIFLFIPFCFSLLFSSLISPFFLYFSISVFLFLFFSPSYVSLFFFFLHRRFCVSSFCLSSLFFSLSFVLELIILFILLLYPIFSSSPYCFCPKKNQKFLLSIFLDEILSLFFELSLLRCFISCFFLLASSSFLVCSMFYRK